MSDNITLPRELVQEALDALEHAARNHGDIYTLQRTALRTALAAEWGAKQEREACAKVCDGWAGYGIPAAAAAADAIRSRGEVKP